MKKLISVLFLMLVVFVLFSATAFAENLYVVSSETYNQELKIGASGASGSPITIKIDAANSSHNGLVIIDTGSYPTKYGINFGGNSYVTVDGFNTYQTGSIGIKVTDTDYSGVFMGPGASYNILRYVDQSYSGIDGIALVREGGHNLEVGVDILNPIQPEVMDIFKLKKKYGKDLTFSGGVSTQKLLPFGMPQQIKDEVRRIAGIMTKNGGYIMEPAISVQPDVPVENIIAFIEAAREFTF